MHKTRNHINLLCCTRKLIKYQVKSLLNTVQRNKILLLFCICSPVVTVLFSSQSTARVSDWDKILNWREAIITPTSPLQRNFHKSQVSDWILQPSVDCPSAEEKPFFQEDFSILKNKLSWSSFSWLADWARGICLVCNRNLKTNGLYHKTTLNSIRTAFQCFVGNI